MSGRLIIIKPDGTKAIEAWISPRKPPSIECLWEAVGGYVERVRVSYEGRVRDAYVDEDGLAKRLDFNSYATALLAPPFYPGLNRLVGKCVIWVPDPLGLPAKAKSEPPGSAAEGPSPTTSPS